ncbi:hypothetical protein COW36_09895 [bacterium (Candidatus Blackallbacteria) CG17_big_fil_post_rev_8_21_14_2_50_48_46]|uniref:peptidylprolyl isomerase n=1 Tax=bacterium (Candidatus Blackallbacteria) CG17_big_fil_post_rev_8_21_14_2_50_48_46 TaxID=2014261 RepID=A0A2M7G5C3_9BACT|nr:MAG: hypothetical protein COW64_26025 [bacterium (Candidatus Blackallbacteria) CG18_big_fil_WC_8_21_14_2_50_49_26]PIW17158.1 MAG: hypothetical protein COW36_09895 [bacterium (Candidatus Blackallbacteria) CG17_big_fil_post_rev_8_21_14_2_50_48_46]PIW44484.1 MAG: hypothetical protein COW20_24000 [bacterium (Candidatus Blackallbacteria) CG13_big_fil_rev_8_21_14_2_50_49_14]
MSNSHLTQKGIVAIALVVFMGGGFTAGTWYWVNRYDYVARVNGERVTRTDFARSFEQATQLYTRQLGMDLNSEQGKMLLPMLRETTLNQLIENQLQLQEAKKRKLTVTAAEIEAEYDKYLRTAYQGDTARMERELARNNYSLSDFREELRSRLLMRKLREALGKDLKLTEKQLENYYKQNSSRFQQPEKIEARHLLIKVEKPEQEAAAKAQIEKILTELKAGGDFAALAKKYSQDTSNKDKGGDLGAFAKGDMVPAFETAAWALKPGEFSQTPVKTEFGYHLILRGKTHPAGLPPLAEARKQFESQLLDQEKEKALRTWLKEQRNQSEIVLAEDMEKPPAPPSPAASSAQASPIAEASAQPQTVPASPDKSGAPKSSSAP